MAEVAEVADVADAPADLSKITPTFVMTLSNSLLLSLSPFQIC